MVAKHDFLCTRDPVTFLVDGQKVFGVIHRPASAIKRARPAMLILHGLVGSKDQPHQIFVKLAEALAAEGWVALRIDFRGRGDSEGNTALDVTPEGDLRDAQQALDVLAAQTNVDPQRMGVLGLSWGGAVAGMLAGRDPRVAWSVLWNAPPESHTWQPATEDYQWIDDRPVLELWGNLIGKQFYADMASFDVQKALGQAHGPVLVVQSAADEAARDPAQSARLFAEVLDEAKVPHQVIMIPDADHGFMRVSWERELIARTVAWLRVMEGGQRHEA